ncbi:MAG: carbon-nitrogen hydrolase family protein [Labilithrix sp.]|nr:carbon-nitrogen hydrolase family protein [Labilithrix sp.]
MRVTVLELPATWNEPAAALAAVDRELERGPRTDLVLLPEASLTGYVSPEGDFDLTRFAEGPGGPLAREIAAIASRRGVTLVAPLVLREGSACFNAMIAQGPGGERVFTYRKRHPWIPETWAAAGEVAAPVVTIGQARVTIAICFDVHFLEEEASSALRASDLLLFPSAWVEESDSRPLLLAEIARTYGVAVANANWGPGVVTVAGQGGSAILDGRGRVLSRVAPGAVRADAAVAP